MVYKEPYLDLSGKDWLIILEILNLNLFQWLLVTSVSPCWEEDEIICICIMDMCFTLSENI